MRDTAAGLVAGLWAVLIPAAAVLAAPLLPAHSLARPAGLLSIAEQSGAAQSAGGTPPGPAVAGSPAPPSVAPPPAGATPAGDAPRPAPRRPLPPPTLPPESATADREVPVACAWIGQRIVSLLARDDAMAANDFIPFYERFSCPDDALRAAFSCVVTAAGVVDNHSFSDRVAACWLDPTTRFAAEPSKPEPAAVNGAAASGQPATAAPPPSAQ